MSYCVNCGVELSDYHNKCPLCDTQVNNPNREAEKINTDYPDYGRTPIKEDKRVRKILTGIILSVQMAVYSFITLFIDLLTGNDGVGWSLIPVLSLAMLWITVAYPFFRRKNTFFKLFTIDNIAVTLYLLLLNIVISGHITWSIYTTMSLLIVWVIIAGIFLTEKIRKFLPITLYYVFSAVIIGIIIVMLVNNKMLTSNIMPIIFAAMLTLSLISYFVIKASVNSALGLVMVLLVDVSLMSLIVDLTVNYYIFDMVRVTWSIIVNAVTVPLITTMYAIRRSSEIRAIISKKLHR